MKGRPILRAVLLAAVVAPVLLIGHPPASASINSTTATAGTVKLSGGISYPCSPATTPNTQKCPFPEAPKPAPWGNFRSFSISANVCVGSYTEVAKGGTPVTIYAGVCAFAAVGVLKLDCIVGDGVGSGHVTFTSPLGGAVTRGLSFAIKFVAGNMILTGTTSTGGTFVADLQGVLPTTPGDSCLDKTGTTINFSGSKSITTLNT